MPVSNKVDQLKVNVATSMSVKSELGEPALVLGIREPIFIYSSQITVRILFFEPKVVSRDVLVLYFNKKKRLKKREGAYKLIMLPFLLTGRLSNFQKVKIFPQRFLIEFPKTTHFYLGCETEDILLQFHQDV